MLFSNTPNFKRGLYVAALVLFVMCASFPMLVNAAPNITLNPASGPPNTVVTVTGSGFTPNIQINVLTWNNTGSLTFTADPYGNLNATLTVPTLNPGNYQFIIADAYTHATTQTQFTITQLSPTPSVSEIPVVTFTIILMLFIGAIVLTAKRKIR